MNQEGSNFNGGNNNVGNNNKIVGYDPQTGKPIFANNQGNVNSIPVKKKKLKWWVPLLFFVGGFFFSILNFIILLFITLQDDITLEYKFRESGIPGVFSFLSIISWLMVVPSLIVVIVKYVRNK